MSLATNLGPGSLFQMGVSLTDIAIVLEQGRRFGNWFATKRNDEDLFESLMEDPEVLLKNKGILDPSRLESLFPSTEFLYQGERIRTPHKDIKGGKGQNLRPFSWFMVVIVSVLDICLPQPAVKELIIDVIVDILQNEEVRSSLRVNLDINIESWRSVGKVRKLVSHAQGSFQKSWIAKTGNEAIPQLNQAERQEMTAFLVTLLTASTPGFSCLSATTFAAARAIQHVGVHINTTGPRTFPEEFVVTYTSEIQGQSETGSKHHIREYDDPLRLERGVSTRAQVVSYPASKPASMIHATEASRATITHMAMMWELGSRAATKFSFIAKADLPFKDSTEIYYQLEYNSLAEQGFGASVSIIACKAFPYSSSEILAGVEKLTEGQSTHRLEWLETHIGLEYLARDDTALPSRRAENMDLWLSYQALVFGFYYKLMEPLVVLDFMSVKDAYFQGLWGYGSTTFLAMCTQFGQLMRRDLRVGRSHVLHMLATMYGGRQKMYSPSSRTNLIGVLGKTSIVALPLLRSTDVPQEVSRYAIIDLPIVGLISDEHGDLFAGSGVGLAFNADQVKPKAIRPGGPGKKWSVHPSMRNAFLGGGSGVVLAARCGGRLVGWFSSTAADTMFLSTAHVGKQHEDEVDFEDTAEIAGAEITDDDWQNGSVWRSMPMENPGCSFGVVHSAGCPALRYAAAGFYGGIGEELSIATDDFAAAFGRIEAQESGVVIA